MIIGENKIHTDTCTKYLKISVAQTPAVGHFTAFSSVAFITMRKLILLTSILPVTSCFHGLRSFK